MVRNHERHLFHKQGNAHTQLLTLSTHHIYTKHYPLTHKLKQDHETNYFRTHNRNTII